MLKRGGTMLKREGDGGTMLKRKYFRGYYVKERDESSEQSQ